MSGVRGGWRRWLALLFATWLVLVAVLAYPIAARGPELLGCVRTLIWGIPAALGWLEEPGSILNSWRNPGFLLLLGLLPVVYWRGTWGEDRRVPHLRLGTVGPLLRAPLGWRGWLRDVPGVVRTGALGALIVALAGPMNSLTPQTTEEEGIDAVIVLDLSLSMQAVLDNVPPELAPLVERKSRALRPTRIDVAKAVLRDFIARRKTDRLGIVVFAKEAFVLSPPTLDYQLLDKLVASLELGVVEGNATAIGDALGVASARLRRSTAKSKTIILLTDGDNNSGRVSPEYAADLAAKLGIKVHTVLIGQDEWATLQNGFDLFGNPQYTRTKQMPANPALLERIAERTGGTPYVATDAAALQATLHRVLDELEKTRFAASFTTFEDLFRYFLLPGVLLLGLDALLRSVVLRRFP